MLAVVDAGDVERSCKSCLVYCRTVVDGSRRVRNTPLMIWIHVSTVQLLWHMVVSVLVLLSRPVQWSRTMIPKYKVPYSRIVTFLSVRIRSTKKNGNDVVEIRVLLGEVLDFGRGDDDDDDDDDVCGLVRLVLVIVIGG